MVPRTGWFGVDTAANGTGTGRPKATEWHTATIRQVRTGGRGTIWHLLVNEATQVPGMAEGRTRSCEREL